MFAIVATRRLTFAEDFADDSTPVSRMLKIMVDGASTSQGSFYMLTDAQKAMLKDGETCTVNGYFVSISKSGGVPKFFNILLTGVESSAKSSANVKRRVATMGSVIGIFHASEACPVTPFQRIKHILACFCCGIRICS